MSITASVYKKRFLQKRTVLAAVETLFWQLGTYFSGRCRRREVAVVERFKQELMYELSAGTKKCGRCREVAVSGGLTVVFLWMNSKGCSGDFCRRNLLNTCKIFAFEKIPNQ